MLFRSAICANWKPLLLPEIRKLFWLKRCISTASRNILVWNEALHGVARAGVATVFPQAIGLAATFDKELLQEIGDVVSTEGRAKFNEFSRE